MASSWWWMPRLQWRACVCLDDEEGMERKNLKIFWRVKSETHAKDELTADESELIAVLLRSCSQVIASAIWQRRKTILRDDFDIIREEQVLIKILRKIIPTTLNQLLIKFGYGAFNKAEAKAKAEAIARIKKMEVQLYKLDNLNKHLLAGNQVLKMVEATNEAETIDQLLKVNLDETLLNEFQPLGPELKNMTVHDLQAIEEYMAVLIDEARGIMNKLLSASAAVVETTEEQQPLQSEVHEALNPKPQVDSGCDVCKMAEAEAKAETKAKAEAEAEDDAEAKFEASGNITPMQIQLHNLDSLNNHLLTGNQVEMVEAKNEAEAIQYGALQDTELTSIKKRKVRRGTRGGGRKINYKKTPEGQTKISDTLKEPQRDVTENPNTKPLDETKVAMEELPDEEKVEAPRDPQKPVPKRKEGRKEMSHWTFKQAQRILQASAGPENTQKTGGVPTVLQKRLLKQEVEQHHRAERSTQAPRKNGNDGRRPWRAKMTSVS